MLKALEPEAPNSHMSFFQGVMPHLSKYDDCEVLEFQMGVLQLIANINEKRKRTQPPTFSYHHQQFSAPQPPSFPNPQPSCSNLFNPPTTYHTSFSQHPQFFNSQNNPLPHPTNQKNNTLRREPSTRLPYQLSSIFKSLTSRLQLPLHTATKRTVLLQLCLDLQRTQSILQF